MTGNPIGIANDGSVVFASAAGAVKQTMVVEIVWTLPKLPNMTVEEETENLRSLLLDAIGFPEHVDCQVKILSLTPPAPDPSSA